MLAVKAFGILVKVGEQIRGLVPSVHLADVMMKNPEKKYHLGDEVKCRVSPCGSPCWVGVRWEERDSKLTFLPFSVK